MIDVDPDIAAGLDKMAAGAERAEPDWGDVLARASEPAAAGARWAGRLAVPAVGLAIAGLIAIVLVTHGPAQTSGGGAGSCAARAVYHGVQYDGEGVQVAPVPAGPAGSAILPACADGPGAGQQTGAQTVRVLRIRGVSPRIAFMQAGGMKDAIYVRDSLARHLPRAVRRLLHAPACRLADAPIRLDVRWDGVLAANGGTELDWRPPYDLDVFVRRASAARYLRAFLTVRVPASLGRPLARGDLERPLAITATCAGGRYVAESVRVLGPG